MITPAEARTHYTAPRGGDQPLLLWGPPVGAPVATVVLFHGGGWHQGSPEQFSAHCRLLASRGVLAASAGYRLIGQGATGLTDCLADTRAATEHVRALAPDAPLFLGGGSAGAQLALTTALTATAPSCAGLLLFNPVVDLCDLGEGLDPLREALGLTPETAPALSPLHLVRPGIPPAIVFHGTADALVPIDAVRRFRDTVQASGGSCRLIEYEGAPHGFFNPGTGEQRWFQEPAAEATAFVLDRSERPAPGAPAGPDQYLAEEWRTHGTP